MEAHSDVSSGTHSTRRFSSRQTRDSGSVYRQERHSSVPARRFHSVSLHEPQNSDDYASLRTHAAFAGSMVPGVGSQFQTVPQNLNIPKEIEIATRSPSSQHSGRPTSNVLSKNQDSGTCTRCFKDNHKCHRRGSTLHKQSRKCLRCLAFNYTCELLPAESRNVPQKTSATIPVAPRSQSIRTVPVPEPILVPARHDTPQHVPVDVQLSDGSDHCKVSTTVRTARLIPSQEGQNPPTSYELDVSSVIERLLELAIPHNSHHEQPCPLSTSLSMRVEALAKQIPVPDATSGGSAFAGVASARDGSKSYARQASRQPPDTDSESDQEDPGDEDDGHSPQNGEDLLEGTRQQTLACPLAKNPQHLHDHPECHRCLTVTLRSMNALVQHMKRTHNYCVRCRSKFPSLEEFSNLIPKHRHCNKCHQVFETSRDLKSHRLRRCHTQDKRHEKEKWYAIWDSFFPGEPRPASHHADYVPTIQKDSQFASWIRDLPEHCRLFIRSQILAFGIVSSTPTPWQLEILDSMLGRPIDGFDTSLSTLDSFQHDTNASGPMINLAAMSPNSVADTSLLSITSQASSPPYQPFNQPQQGGSVPQMQFPDFMQPIHGQNDLHLSTSIPSTQQTLPSSQIEAYNSWPHPNQWAGQPPAQIQPGRYGNTLSPDQASMHSRGMPGSIGQNYLYYPNSFSQHHPNSAYLTTPRGLASPSTSLTPSFHQPNTATVPDQSMSERNSVNTRTYYYEHR